MIKKPNFIFVGPDKTGSSWIYNILSAHPECFIPPAKDIYFFDRYFDKGFMWYFRHFEKAPRDVKAIGELSHDYLFSEIAAKRINSALKDVTIIICLRDPINRSLSQFQYMRRGGEVADDFYAAIAQYPKIITNSQYLKNLQRYINIFGRDKIEILIFDDLQANPEVFGRELLTRLELSPDINLDFNKKVRAATMARNKYLSLSLKTSANIARNIGLSNLVGRAKNSKLADYAYREIKASEKTLLTSEQKQCLWNKYFAHEIATLSDIIDRDLSQWNPGVST